MTPMALSAFNDVWERIDRAHSHGRDMSNLWSAFLEDDPYSPHVEVEDDGTGRLWIVPQRSLPKAFSLMLGEVLYQLRAALDASVYSAAILDSGQAPPPDAEKLEFPICSSQRKFKDAAWKIRPLAQQRRAIIESVQPYNAAQARPNERAVNDYLGLLNDLARRDRHRRLHVIASRTSQAAPLFRPSDVRIVHLHVKPDGFIDPEHDTQIAEFTIDDWTPGKKIQANPNLMIDIALDETVPAPGGTYELGTIMGRMVVAVTVIVQKIERSF